MPATADFERDFTRVFGLPPLAWQRRLFGLFMAGEVPSALDLPTGLGKTSVMAIWLIARAHGASLPRRLVYVVDRRVVVDQATSEAIKLREGFEWLPHLKAALGLEGRQLPISTLRGQFVDNREWLEDPAAPAIIIGTVDMIGSRLLFSGYGVSSKMRPYHAGLLGVDALIVLDEAHLVPPFERLLETIEMGRDIFGPQASEVYNAIPPFKLLSLSATGGPRKGELFRLVDEDLSDPLVAKRLASKKVLAVASPVEAKLSVDLARQAWALSDDGKAHIRCLVYCNSRAVAEETYDTIKTFAAGDKKKAAISIAAELLVGARRVRERDDVREWLEKNGFVAGSGSPHQPSFLIATSAGEVGIDLDADHMVCDLAPWERMVQRLGRVNRRGDGHARIIVIAGEEPKPKKPDSLTAEENRALIAYRTLQLIQSLPSQDAGYDASPGALLGLKRRAEGDPGLSDRIAAATTPAPLRPALTRPLVEAWAMTSLQTHTGRPEVAPWLRGWVDEDEPQTVLVWRKFLPVRREGGHASDKEMTDFFEAAPPHTSEQLETETWRVVEWLMDRASRLTQALGKNETVSDDDDNPTNLSPLTKKDIVVLALGSDDKLIKKYFLSDLVKSDQDKKRQDRLSDEFAGATLILDARLAGLEQGILKKDAEALPSTADADEEWSQKIGVRVERRSNLDPTDWRFEDDFVTARTEEGEPTEWLIVERLKAANSSEDGRSISNPQSLAEHQSCATEKARIIASALGLRPDFVRTLEIAARLHDEGKRALHWQRAFNAPRDAKRSGLSGPLAKTRGPINQALLDGYRHEFGSLSIIEDDLEFKTLSSNLQNLVLHIVAAHHGRARPVIETKSCDDAPPSALEARARDVALRFARLQKIWGPWGIAWWESLLRAADQQASRQNDERKDADGHTASGEAA